MMIIFWILLIAGGVLLVLFKKFPVLKMAGALCLLAGALGALIMVLKAGGEASHELSRQVRVGKLAGEIVKDAMPEGGKVVLVCWPEIDEGVANLNAQMELGLNAVLGKGYELELFPAYPLEASDRAGMMRDCPPAGKWRALAESLPDCDILVSMVGHPPYRVAGLYTRSGALVIEDVFWTLHNSSEIVDTNALFLGHMGHPVHPGSKENFRYAIEWFPANRGK